MAAPTQLVIVRHAERLDEVPGNTWGDQADELWYDPPITMRGADQAAAAAAGAVAAIHRAEPLDVIYTSPFRRCVQTAAIIAHSLDLPLQIVDGLGECAAAGRKMGMSNVRLLGELELASLCTTHLQGRSQGSNLSSSSMGSVGSTSSGRSAGTASFGWSCCSSRNDSSADLEAMGSLTIDDRAGGGAGGGDVDGDGDGAKSQAQAQPVVRFLPRISSASRFGPAVRLVAEANPGRTIVCVSHREAASELDARAGVRHVRQQYCGVSKYVYTHTTGKWSRP